jgi:hypothetical protein
MHSLLRKLIPYSVRQSCNRLLGRSRFVPSDQKALPGFLIIGSQKCGTTSLYAYLCDHPQVVPAAVKEVKFFDNLYHKGLAWYRAQFPYALKDRTRLGEGLLGEATPTYMDHPHAPRRVYETLPHVKLIVLMRNPVDRAISHYYQERKYGLEELSLVEALQKEEIRLAGEIDKILRDETYYSIQYDRRCYMTRGIYVDQLQAWRKYFPAEQMLILKGEDMYRDPGAVCKQAMRFLNLPEVELSDYETHNSNSYPKVDAATRNYLAKVFQPHNRRLYDFLGMDLGWEKDMSAKTTYTRAA